MTTPARVTRAAPHRSRTRTIEPSSPPPDAPPRRPPPVQVDDSLDSPVRRDIDSEDVRRVHPDLPRECARLRAEYVLACDRRALEREWCVAFAPPRRAASPAAAQDAATSAVVVGSSGSLYTLRRP